MTKKGRQGKKALSRYRRLDHKYHLLYKNLLKRSVLEWPILGLEETMRRHIISNDALYRLATLRYRAEMRVSHLSQHLWP